MATAYNVQAWDKTAANNDGADSGIGAVGNTSSPGVVDDWTKGIMASIAKLTDDIHGGLVASGTNTLTLTTNQSLSAGHIAAGLMLSFRVANTNTGAVTLNPDSTGAVAVVDQSGNALAGGELVAGMMAMVMYNANTSNWRLVSAHPSATTPGVVLLESGTISNDATLDIVLTSYTGNRSLIFELTDVVPAADAQIIYMRFSTNGGSSYVATNYVHGELTWTSGSATSSVTATETGTGIPIAAAASSDSGARLNAKIRLPNQTATQRPGVFFESVYGSTDGDVYFNAGGHGGHKTAQDVDAVRFLANSGNLSSGGYAVYGLF